MRRALKSTMAFLVLFAPLFFAASDFYRSPDSTVSAALEDFPGRPKRENITPLETGRRHRRNPSDINPALSWNTFLGSTHMDTSEDVAVDAFGNIYVVGTSRAAWGSPLRAYSGSDDAFIAKLGSDGHLVWNTFLGGAETDSGNGVAVDTAGNIYVVGTGEAAWGTPIRVFTGSADAFVAKLDGNGVLQWNTFLGGDDRLDPADFSANDEGKGIAVDATGDLLVAGSSPMSWGSPLRAFSPAYDVFVAKLKTDGRLQWNTFLGGAGFDQGGDIAVNPAGDIFMTGTSEAAWGSPIDAYSGNSDAFAVRLASSGLLRWNTFLGGPESDGGTAVAVNANGNSFIAGWSNGTWGAPNHEYYGGGDAFVAKLGPGGLRQWNTFLGGVYGDEGNGIALDSKGNAVLFGAGGGPWDVTSGPEAYDDCAFLAIIEPDGTRRSDLAFLGSVQFDDGRGIAIGPLGKIIVAGTSEGTWGAPVRSYSGDMDGYAAKHKTCTLTLSSDSRGTTFPAPGSYTFLPGTTFTVAALPGQSCAFVKWTGDVPAGQETLTHLSVLMDTDKSIRANFIYIGEPANLQAIRLTNRSLTQLEYVVDLSWAANPANEGLAISAYRVYQEILRSYVCIATLSATEFGYRVRNVPASEQSFAVTAVTADGLESAKAYIRK